MLNKSSKLATVKKQIKFSERDNSMSKIQAGRTIVGYQTDIMNYYKRSYASKKK